MTYFRTRDKHLPEPRMTHYNNAHMHHQASIFNTNIPKALDSANRQTELFGMDVIESDIACHHCGINDRDYFQCHATTMTDMMKCSPDYGIGKPRVPFMLCVGTYVTSNMNKYPLPAFYVWPEFDGQWAIYMIINVNSGQIFSYIFISVRTIIGLGNGLVWNSW